MLANIKEAKNVGLSASPKIKIEELKCVKPMKTAVITSHNSCNH